MEFSLCVFEHLRWHLPGFYVVDVSVDGKEIQPAVVVQIGQLAAEAEPFEGRFAELGDSSRIGEQAGLGLTVKGADLVSKIGDDQIE